MKERKLRKLMTAIGIAEITITLALIILILSWCSCKHSKPTNNPPSSCSNSKIIKRKTSDGYLTKASWYGPKYHKKIGANGKPFNMYALTAAHKTLPFGTIVKITNPENNKSVVVKITDRGPYINNREFDLSYQAAKKIGLTRKGVTTVKVKILNTKSSFYYYRVKKRDNLWKLFRNRWKIVARLNKISPKKLKPNMKLIVPYHW